VTIAIGILCSDGIVLCADSKESNYQTKIYRPKIVQLDVLDDDIKVVLAGSGDSDFLDALKEKVEQAVDVAAPTLASVESKIETGIQSYCRKIWPLYDQSHRPTADMLIGIRTPDGQSLLRTNGPIVRSAHRPYESIGFGADFSAYHLDRLFTGDRTIAAVCPIAIYVLQLVKENIEFCGGPSHVFTVSAASVEQKSADEISSLVDRFREFATITDKLLARAASLQFQEATMLSHLVNLYEELPQLQREKGRNLELYAELHSMAAKLTIQELSAFQEELKELVTAEQLEELRGALKTVRKYIAIAEERTGLSADQLGLQESDQGDIEKVKERIKARRSGALESGSQESQES
jgi:20S proteasome alpha/beta subunit